jgi:hypothetical protein
MHSSTVTNQLNTRDQLLHLFPNLFPGIDRVVMLYVTENKGTGGRELTLTGNQYLTKELLTEGMEIQLKQMGGEQPGYSWLHKDQLPFEQRRVESNQPQLFSEQYHIVLMLRLKSVDSPCLDVFYLFFREDQSNFGISRLQGSLDTTRKALVGSLVYRFALLFHQSATNWQAALSEFTNVTRILLKNTQENADKADFKNWISQWAEDYLGTINRNNNQQIRLSEQAIHKLMVCGDFHLASEALRKAAAFAVMLNSDTHENEIIIEANYLLIEAKTTGLQASELGKVGTLPDRLNKTLVFLDKLENSANKLMNGGEGITSHGVGQTMDRPISAPAISDALRKNRRRIIVLLDKHPDRWPLIRSHFRPLINLVDKKGAELSNIG